MAKRFMYVSIGVLCLVAAYQLGAKRAAAEWDGSAAGIIGMGALPVPGPNGGVFYGADGAAWIVGPEALWARREDLDLPVASAEVKFLDTDNAGTVSANIVLVTTSDVVWACIGYESGEWVARSRRRAIPGRGSSGGFGNSLVIGPRDYGGDESMAHCEDSATSGGNPD
jgi:hypothetical protein